MNSVLSTILIILGIIVLTTGRKLYWLFVAVLGIVFGMYIARDLFLLDQDWMIQLIGLGTGVLAAIYGAFLRSKTVAVVSFIAGGYGASYIAGRLGYGSGELLFWVIFIVGGIFGLILLATSDDWALILLSSWAGATWVIKYTHPRPFISVLILLALLLVGVLIQALTLRIEIKLRPVHRNVKEGEEKQVE